MNPTDTDSTRNLAERIKSVDWYHTIDLGNGIVTPGHYDHRPYLHLYGLPESLAGKTALDLGTASGFFAFELEKRGARVTATDLPEWYEHDFGPGYSIDKTPEGLQNYLVQPFEIAREALGSQVEKKFVNIYDVSPETVGEHDVVFCGSLLIHLSDPVKALWNIAGVTREKAIIATVIRPDEMDRPLAEFVGYNNADSWWVPSRRCLELMAASAGFAGIEWVSDFRLDYRDGSPGPYHGVLHAYKTAEGWTPQTRPSEAIIEEQKKLAREDSERVDAQIRQIQLLQDEVARLRSEVESYERRRFIRLTRRLRGQ